MAYILLIGLVLGWILGWVLPSDKMLTILSVLSFFVAGVLIMVDTSGILSIIGIGFIIVGVCFEKVRERRKEDKRGVKEVWKY